MTEYSQLSIRKIKEIIKKAPSKELVEALSRDPRKGVASLVQSYHKTLEKEKKLKARTDILYEPLQEMLAQGYNLPGGNDEAGRGPLAGPVVAACVVLPMDPKIHVYDSKKLPEKKRDLLFEEISLHAISIGTGIVSPQEIDKLNIYRATQVAMRRAWESAIPIPDFCFIDAMEIAIPVPQKSLIKGDAKCAPISAASIIAKVTRDKIMKDAAAQWPAYGFDTHKGYGSPSHIRALEKHGPCPIHRTSFAPVSDFILPTKEWFEILLKRCTSLEALHATGMKIQKHKNDLLSSEVDDLREVYTECIQEIQGKKVHH